MDLSDLAGRTFGPSPLAVTPERVADFVGATGDDPERWIGHAPPAFASAALFVVAPSLLDELSGRSVIHGEQAFSWHAPFAVGDTLEVVGTVSRVRERAGIVYVGFDVEAHSGGAPVMGGSALFLVSGDALAAEADYERPEPPQAHRGDPGRGQRAASRADLVRYAAASRDWNPVHWDHAAAVAAGLPGVVVHGLLQAAWATQAVTSGVEGPVPLSYGRFRFRSPLFPARPVDVATEGEGPQVTVSVSDPDQEYLNARIELANG
jgi:acyl dehydratase